jgi:hypothetical protein
VNSPFVRGGNADPGEPRIGVLDTSFVGANAAQTLFGRLSELFLPPHNMIATDIEAVVSISILVVSFHNAFWMPGFLAKLFIV